MNNVVLNTRRHPLTIIDQMDRIMDSIFEDAGTTLQSGRRVPAVDVQELEDRYIMSVDVPGLSESDVEIKVDDNLLTLSSQKQATEEAKRDGYLIRERRLASFARSFSLPSDVDREQISATAANGVLTVTLPKQEKAKPRVIEVKRA